MSTKPDHIRRMFSLGGMSECGKSEAGRFFAENGIERLKIARFIEAIAETRGYNIRDDTFTDRLFDDDPKGVLSEFSERVAGHKKRRGLRYSSLESMYRLQMASFLKRVLGDRMINIYIDAPFNIRVEREWTKLGGSASIDDVAKRVNEKDEIKTRIGVPSLRAAADIIIDNSKSLEEYKFRLTGILAEYCPDLNA